MGETLAATAAPQHRLESAVTFTHDHVSWLETKGRLWKWGYYGVGAVATSLTALAGVAVLADWFGRTVPGVIAVLAALLTALIGFLDFGGRMVRVRLERAAWHKLYQRSLSLLEFPSLEGGAPRAAVDALYDAICTQQQDGAGPRVRV